ncbi:MAG: nucleotidyltransferase [Deltaproteobacteria bacterium]|nr:nucleotidyltransferase [Deltaproteobacteria bacterium]
MQRLSSDLREFIQLLNTKSVRYLIVGAWALAFHGRPRYTGDIDIFVAREQDNAEKLMEVIEAFGFGQSGIQREDFLQADYVIQLGRAPNRIDLLTGISGVAFDEAWESREQGRISDIQGSFISRDLLIKNKRAANREKDQADIKLLEKTRPRRPPES